jgi:hypothetical protein
MKNLLLLNPHLFYGKVDNFIINILLLLLHSLFATKQSCGQENQIQFTVLLEGKIGVVQILR